MLSLFPEADKDHADIAIGDVLHEGGLAHLEPRGGFIGEIYMVGGDVPIVGVRDRSHHPSPLPLRARAAGASGRGIQSGRNAPSGQHVA